MKSVLILVGSIVALGTLGSRHIELVSSNPTADEVLTAAPQELVLNFSADLDRAQTAATLRTAGGQPVELGDAQAGDDPRQLKVPIVGEMGAGSYTVAWTAAPKDDHGGRGRFSFEVQ